MFKCPECGANLDISIVNAERDTVIECDECEHEIKLEKLLGANPVEDIDE